MLKELLSDDLYNVFNSHIAMSEVTEIRIRQDKPIVVFLKSQPYYISYSGLCCNIKNAIFGTREMIADIVYKASDYSIYAVNEQIKKGYLMLSSGVRIGFGGSFVYENDSIKTITNWTSLNIRIPHQIKNISLCAFDDMVTENGIKNTLIISPPGAGKTTFIRDFVAQLSDKNFCINVCVIDERGEIAGYEGTYLGNYCDVLSNVTKKDGFNIAIRSLSPGLIVTDEIGSEEDAKSLIEAMNCGVKVVATIHASTIEELKRKKFFSELPSCYFERYVVLSLKNGPGTFEGVYNEKFAKILRW